jgi:DNA-binding transcriptional LysR family regulator
MDKLAAMRAFVEIVDHGSLTAAAGALDRAPPTMVRTLAALEQRVGARLLNRTTRSMSLTEEGRVYVERCRRILADVSEAEAAVSSDGSEPRGEIRLTAPVLFGQRHVLPALVDFARRYSEVRIELLLLDRIVHLVEEGLDLGIRIGSLPDSSMIAVPVGHMRRVVVASEKVLERSGVPEHPRDLAQQPCVLFRGLTSASTWYFYEHDRRVGIDVTASFICNQAEAAVEACAAGLGFGSFLSYQVEPQVRNGVLQVVLEAFESTPAPINLVCSHARLMSPRLRLLVDHLKAHLRARPELA